MAKAYCGERISQHLIRDNAGFLVATSQPIARSGNQNYIHNEIDPTSGDDSIVEVYRPPEEVLSSATIASGEGKPITMRHPAKFLDSNTVGWSSRGHIQDVRQGPDDENGNVTLVADLHIHDGSLINEILSKSLRDISMGYTYDLDVGPRAGTFSQRNIRMNHCAVVERGRAGTTYITDSNEDKEDMDNAKLDHLCELLEKFVTQRRDQEEERFNPRSSAYDSRSRRGSDAADFEARAALFHRKNIKVHGVTPTDERRGEDASRHQETFDKAVERVRNEQQAKFKPRI